MAFEDVGQQLFDVGADRRGAAAQGDVLPERDARRSRFVFWDSNPADGAAGTGDLESGHHRLLEADALQHRVDAEAVCELAHALDRGVTAFGDDVRGAELPAERGPLRVAAEQDDLLGAQPRGGDHAAEADGAVADHRGGLAG